MRTQFEELKMYESFDELANDVLDLAHEILPEQMFYLTAFTDSQQVILKLSNQKSSIQITENMVVDLSNSVCGRIDFENNQPLRYEDVKRDCDVEEVERLLDDVNIRSYLGIPISLTNEYHVVATNRETVLVLFRIRTIRMAGHADGALQSALFDEVLRRPLERARGAVLPRLGRI